MCECVCVCVQCMLCLLCAGVGVDTVYSVRILLYPFSRVAPLRNQISYWYRADSRVSRVVSVLVNSHLVFSQYALFFISTTDQINYCSCFI